MGHAIEEVSTLQAWQLAQTLSTLPMRQTYQQSMTMAPTHSHRGDRGAIIFAARSAISSNCGHSRWFVQWIFSATNIVAAVEVAVACTLHSAA